MVVCEVSSAPSLPPGAVSVCGQVTAPVAPSTSGVRGAAEGDVERAVAVRVARRDLAELGELVEERRRGGRAGRWAGGRAAICSLIASLSRCDLAGAASTRAGGRSISDAYSAAAVLETALRRASRSFSAPASAWPLAIDGALRGAGRSGWSRASPQESQNLPSRRGDAVVARLAELVLDARRGRRRVVVVGRRAPCSGRGTGGRGTRRACGGRPRLDALAELRAGAVGERAGGDRAAASRCRATASWRV